MLLGSNFFSFNKYHNSIILSTFVNYIYNLPYFLELENEPSRIAICTSGLRWLRLITAGNI